MKYTVNFQTNAILVIIIALISTVMLMVPVAIVNAVPGDSSDDRCHKIDSSKTIGQVECCDVDINDGHWYCTICDATNPPSNCSERYPHIVYKEDPTDESDQPGPFVNPDKGEVLEKLSDQRLEQAPPSGNQKSGSSMPEGIQSDSTGLGTTFNEVLQNGDLNEAENNDTS